MRQPHALLRCLAGPLLPTLLLPLWLLAAPAAGAAMPADVAAVQATARERLAPALREGLERRGGGADSAPMDVVVWFDGDASLPASGRARRGEATALRAADAGRLHRLAREGAALRARVTTGSDAPEWRGGYRHLPAARFRVLGARQLARLAADPSVRRIEPDRELVPHLLQSLPLTGQPAAVARGVTGAGTAVVVLDTGTDYTRSDFGCTAPGVPATCRVVHAEDIAPQDNQLDTTGHGSNVSAIVAATAPGTRIIALDVFTGATASLSHVLAGIEWAIDHRDTYGIVAINMSLGFSDAFFAQECPSVISGYVGPAPIYSFFNPFQEALSAAEAVGISVVASAGNEARLDGLPMPACTPEVISVGAVYDANVGARSWPACSDATTAADRVTCFSNAADHLDILAPGALVTAGGASWGGTSQAAPHVAGAVALVRDAWPAEAPEGVRARIVGAGRPVSDTRTVPARTFPRLDIDAVFPLPVNDDFTDALALTGDAAQWSGSNLFATTEAGEPLHAGVAGGASLWFEWTPASSTRFRITTSGSGIDTLLAVYTGSGLASLMPIASDDGSAGNRAAEVLVDAIAGQTYRIAVAGKAAATGDVRVDIGVSASADLSTTLVLTPAVVVTGTPLTAQVTVRNSGPLAATNTVLTLTLPAGTTGLQPWPAGCAPGGPGMQCALGSVAPGGVRAIDFPLLAAQAGDWQVSAAPRSNGTPDPLPGNDSATATLSVQTPADVAVTLAPIAASLASGSVFEQSVSITNTGPGAATAVQVEFTLTGPAALELAPDGCTPQVNARWQCVLGSLPAGATVEQQWRVLADAPGLLGVQAEVFTGSADPDTSNDSAQVEASVFAAPDLFVIAEESSSSEGTGISVQVFNVGLGAASGVQVVLELPAGLTMATGTSGCSSAAGVVDCNLGSLPPDGGPASVTVTLRAERAGTWVVPVTATAAEADGNPEDNSRSVSIAFATGSGGEPDPTPVPALPGWAQLVLALGLARLAADRVVGRPSGRQRGRGHPSG